MAANFGKRLRRGAGAAAAAAVVVAALSASQAPGLAQKAKGDDRHASADDSEPGPDAPVTGNSPYYTDLPPLGSPQPPPAVEDPAGASPAESGIPATILDAYKKAETSLAASHPGCHLRWELLAAIGKVESGQARGGRVDSQGTTLTPILGPVLDGNDFARITDTDGGLYDGDTEHDRAIGPMQFIPQTWESWGSDGNADGRRDPNNIYDAALAAGRYLCASGRDLSARDNLDKAILGYNHSGDYLRTVLSWYEYYRKGIHEIPDGTGSLPQHPSGSGAHPGPGPKPTPGGTPSPKPSPSEPGRPGGSPGPTPSTPPTTQPSTPPPVSVVDHLENAGGGTLTAYTGDLIAKRATVRAEDKAGKTLAKVRVRFEITGATGTTFPGGLKIALVESDSTGTATAPVLRAGRTDGDFTVRATVVGRTIAPVDISGAVALRQADALTRTDDTALTCPAGGEFAHDVQVQARYQGAAASGVLTTATLVKSADDPAENDKGPYFKDADGNPVRTLTDLTTDANGLLTLPKLYADDAEGTYLLRLTTTGGATLTVELTVTAPPAAPAA